MKISRLEQQCAQLLGAGQGLSEVRGRICQDLRPNPNKITMKMDVPWTAHSHIIGRGGNTIQSVAKRTGVCIHFPDGNKNSALPKSNQVSITSRGSKVSGLEEARRAIRNLTPLIFSFTLTAETKFVRPIFNFPLIVQNVQNVYNVEVELKRVNKVTILGSVKGVDLHAFRVKDATLCLLNWLCGPSARHMRVHLIMEVSPRYHPNIQGEDCQNIKRIMRQTLTKVIFPDQNDPKLAPLQRCTITIEGAIKNVYTARQKIIGSCPILLVFDLDYGAVDYKFLQQLMQSIDITVGVKDQTVNSHIESVTVRGYERNVAKVYEAWKILTNNSSALPKPNIPANYHISLPPKLISSFPLGGSNSRGDSYWTQALPEINHRPNLVLKTRSPLYTLTKFPPPSVGINYISPDGPKPFIPEPDPVPVDSSSAYGLSKSQPTHLLNKLKFDQWVPNNDYNLSGKANESDIKSTSSLLDFFSISPQIPVPYPKDVFSILLALELTEYIDLFLRNGINFPSFCKLTEQGLKDIGVNSWLHRKKLLGVIKTVSSEPYT